MNIRNLSMLILIGLSVSCSSGSSDSSKVNFDGTYEISATAITPTGIDGGICGDAEGEMVINNSELSGSVLSTEGIVFDISGSVTPSGVITGGFAQGGENAVTFDGTITETGGSGTWSNVFECSGNWEAVKKPSEET